MPKARHADILQTVLSPLRSLLSAFSLIDLERARPSEMTAPHDHKQIPGVIGENLDGDVEGWPDRLSRPSYEGDSYRLDELHGCWLTKVEHWKAVGYGVEHEHLLLELVTRHDDRRFIKLDRNHITASNSHPPLTLSSQTSSHNSSLLVGCNSDKLDKYRILYDPGELTQKPYTLLTTFRFHADNRPNILQLAVLAECVSNAAPYHLWSTMCYWFSRMLYEGLFHLFRDRGEEVYTKKWERRGRYKRLELIDEDLRFRSGAWKRDLPAELDDEVFSQISNNNNNIMLGVPAPNVDDPDRSGSKHGPPPFQRQVPTTLQAILVAYSKHLQDVEAKMTGSVEVNQSVTPSEPLLVFSKHPRKLDKT